VTQCLCTMSHNYESSPQYIPHLVWNATPMNKFFLPTSRKVLPTFQTFCPDGVHFAQTVVHFAHFQNQARKRGVLGWEWGCFVFVHIPERGLWRLSKEQGLVVVFWAKSDPIWAKWDPSGQFVRKVGKSALELGKKNTIIIRMCICVCK
jgi:hypothetical protein